MPLAFIMPLWLMVHEGVSKFEQSFDVPVRGTSFIETLGVDGLQRDLIAQCQRCAVR